MVWNTSLKDHPNNQANAVSKEGFGLVQRLSYMHIYVKGKVSQKVAITENNQKSFNFSPQYLEGFASKCTGLLYTCSWFVFSKAKPLPSSWESTLLSPENWRAGAVKGLRNCPLPWGWWHAGSYRHPTVWSAGPCHQRKTGESWEQTSNSSHWKWQE